MRRLSLFLLCLVAVILACSAPLSMAGPSPTATRQTLFTPTATRLVAEVSATSLHVRTEPMGLRVGYLYHGDTVVMTGRCLQGWAQIEWDGGRGWVNARYLSDNTCRQ